MKRLLLILLLCTVARADDKAAVSAAMHGWGKITKVVLAGDYALVDWQGSEEGAGQGVLRRVDGRWVVLSAGGGVFDTGSLWSLGVPVATMKALHAYESGLAEAQKAGPRWTWLTRERDVGESDLSGMSAFELTLARNEIFAVHGRPFKDPVLAGYFRSRAWYRPNAAYSDAVLTAREKRNSQFIMDYQKSKNLVF